MGYMYTDLATACKKSGLKVVQIDGWKTRTRPGGMATPKPEAILAHWTATSDRAPGNYPTASIIKNGRPGLPGPLAQLGLGRDGTVFVFASGRANHAGRTALLRQSNSHAIGIECEASGAHPIRGKQLDAYIRLVAALCKHYGIPASHVYSHGEAAVPRGRKNDISTSQMPAFRAAVADLMRGKATTAATPAPQALSLPIVEDGVLGGQTYGAWEKYLGNKVDFSWDRDDIRDLQTWASRPRTGVLSKDDVKAIQTKLGVTADGLLGKQSIGALQKFVNRRLAAPAPKA